MSEPYLILHKVRGKPAFDVAIKVQVGAEDETQSGWIGEWWIIPTSGHRAYPSWSKPLSELGIVTLPDTNMAWGYNFDTGTVQGLIPFPYAEPDHYAINDAPKPKPSVRVPTTIDDFLV